MDRPEQDIKDIVCRGKVEAYINRAIWLSWHNGAGERYYDADTSDQFRFYESNNINPWDLGEIKLLPATTNLNTSAATSPATVSSGTFYISGGSVKFYDK